MLGINTEERIERLHLDVKAFHQRNRHRAEIRKAAANRNLRHRVVLRADGREKRCELFDEPLSQVVAPRQYFHAPCSRRRAGSIFIAPRQFARAEQRAVAHEGDARHGGVESDVRLDAAGHGKRLPRSRESQKGVGWRDHGSNAEAGIHERPECRRYLVRIGEREYHRLPVGAFDRRRGRRNIGDGVAGVDSSIPGRGQGFGAHLFVRAVRHDDLPVIASSAPDDNCNRPPSELFETLISFRA